MTRRLLGIAVSAVALLMAVAPGAGAQEDGSGTTVPVNTVPPEGGTSTSLPPGDPGTVPPGSTTTVPGTPPTTTLPPSVTLPPELAGDPRAPLLVDPGPDDGGDVPVGQRSFSPESNRVLAAKVKEARAELAQARGEIEGLRRAIELKRREVDDLAGRVEGLKSEIEKNVRAAVRAREELSEHAVNAYMTGSTEQKMTLVRAEDPVELGVARRYLESVVDADGAALRAYRSARRKLSDNQAALADRLGDARVELAELESRSADAVARVLEITEAVQAYEAGSHVYVEGFVFPVDGEVEFIDSWGYPRMSGTSFAHWHQGTDIFAKMGTPLVAAESGRLRGIGTGTLGGNKLWVVGDSGTEYYYAHLSAYASDIEDGKRVNAGDVVGYVGDTGNAKGTSPHLHFEIHPGGGDAVNPYPLLKAVYGARPMVRIVAGG